MSEQRGMGVAGQASLKTFKAFFIEFTLPYRVIRGEQTKIPLTVHNYLTVCLEVSLGHLARNMALAGSDRLPLGITLASQWSSPSPC